MKDSKGLLIHEGKLIYRNGPEYEMVQDEMGMTLNDGKWHNDFALIEWGKVKIYLDDRYVNQVENSGADLLEGHVLRIGQATKRFRLGASDLPVPFRGESFDGEIRRVRFFDQALSESDISKLSNEEKISKKSLVLDWKIDLSQKQANLKKGPIRIQSDLSKIRYANIWLQPLKD